MQTAQSIKEIQKESWNKFSPGWKKWDHFTMKFLEDQGRQIIESLDLKIYQDVLDVASGTGEPGLTMASIVKGGSVTAVDLSEGMLEIAKDKAAAAGLYNFETKVADVCDLPFEDASFDAISCRLGFMFFPDMQLAAKEMLRVLKPGGRMAVTVWGEPSKNLWITSLMGAIKKNVELPAPPPEGPGMFRCAQPGFMSTLLERVGFEDVIEKEINGYMNCSSTDEYWSFMNDVVPPVVAVFKDSSEAIREKIKQEVYAFIEKECPGKGKDISFGSRIVTLAKPG